MKNIFRTLFLTLLFTVISLNASELKYLNSYEDAIALAKQEKKPLVLFAHTPSCPWCRKMESETLEDPKVIEILNTQFVFLKIDLSLDMQVEDVPIKFLPQGTPTSYVIDPNTQNALFTMRGYKSSKSFLGRLLR